MMKHLLLLGVLCCFIACGGPEPRKPIKVQSGSFFKESVERNKKLLAKEEALIQEIIKEDSTNVYSQSPYGFWYYHEVKQDSTVYLPKTDDEIVLAYNIMSFQNDTLYTIDEIGIVQVLVDKEQLFPGMRGAIKVLQEGEKATFLFPSSLAYGYHGDNDKINPLTPIKSSVEILKINKKSDSLNLKSNP